MTSSIERAIHALHSGDWNLAHTLVQDDPSAEAAWIHAHLHRIEGDLTNARYWYARAGRAPATESLDAERADLTASLRKR